MSGPDVWGPHGWKFIHFVTLGYPEYPSKQDKENYFNFFNSLKNVIPCSICGNNFKEHLKINPLTDKILSDKENFIKWGINMHNLTNRDTNKKTFSFTEGFSEIKKNLDNCDPIESFSNNNIISNNTSLKNTILIFIVLISVLLIMFIFKN